MKKNIFLLIIVSGVIFSFVSAQSLKSTYLKIGKTSETVRGLQQILNELGYLVNDVPGEPGYKNFETNYFGKATYDSVVDFQKRNGLVPDGIVGPKTAAKLEEMYERTIGEKKLQQVSEKFEEAAKQAGYVEPKEIPGGDSGESSSGIDFSQMKTGDLVDLSKQFVQSINDPETLPENRDLNTKALENLYENMIARADSGDRQAAQEIERLTGGDITEVVASKGIDSPNGVDESLLVQEDKGIFDSFGNFKPENALSQMVKNAYEIKKMEKIPGTDKLIDERKEENQKLADLVKQNQKGEELKVEPETKNIDKGELLPDSNEDVSKLSDRELWEKVQKSNDLSDSQLERAKKEIFDNCGGQSAACYQERIDAVKAAESNNSPEGEDAQDTEMNRDFSSQGLKDYLDNRENSSENPELPEVEKGWFENLTDKISETATNIKDKIKEFFEGPEANNPKNLNDSNENPLSKEDQDAAKMAEDYLRENNPELLKKINDDMKALEESSMSTEELMKKYSETLKESLDKATDEGQYDPKKGGTIVKDEDYEFECDDSGKCKKKKETVFQRCNAPKTGPVTDKDCVDVVAEEGEDGGGAVNKKTLVPPGSEAPAKPRILAKPEAVEKQKDGSYKLKQGASEPQIKKINTGDNDVVGKPPEYVDGPTVELTPDSKGCTRDC